MNPDVMAHRAACPPPRSNNLRRKPFAAAETQLRPCSDRAQFFPASTCSSNLRPGDRSGLPVWLQDAIRQKGCESANRLSRPLEGIWQAAAEHSSAFARDINRHRRIHFQQIRQSSAVIAVPVGDDHEIEFRQINAERLDVSLENVGVVPGVKENALPVVLDQRGEAPVLYHLLRIREGIVEDGDAVGCLECGRQKKNGKSGRKPLKNSKRRHGPPPEQCWVANLVVFADEDSRAENGGPKAAL